MEQRIWLAILQEYEKVLSYKKFQLTTEEIEKLIQTAISFSIIVIPKIRIYEIKEDPIDNIFLECALSGDVDYIVTGDKHLLKLNEYRNIKIINGRGLLRIIGK